MRGGIIVAAVLLLASCARQPEPPPAVAPQADSAPRPDPYGPEFRVQWRDGKTEECRYRLRPGNGFVSTVAFVASYSANSRLRVNSDTQSSFPGLQFNLSRQSEQSSELVSIVIALTDVNGLPTGAATKLIRSSHAGSGPAWMQLLFNRDHAISVRHGDDDSTRSVPFSPTTVVEDALPLVARRIAWPRLRLGQTYATQGLTTQLEPSKVTLSLPADRETVETPAGRFRCHHMTARWNDGRTQTWFVEGDPPFRIVKWVFSGGETAELLAARD